jgi:hypothetical protein
LCRQMSFGFRLLCFDAMSRDMQLQ